MHELGGVRDQTSAVACVDHLLERALALGASDIHIEPSRERARVRMRVDGLLQELESIDLMLSPQVVARVKVLAHMNIAERRIPQDGKFAVITEHGPVDIRVATFPTLFGEKAVLRILDHAHAILSLDDLGMSPAMRDAIQKCAARTTGFFMVTGPTGSGKTTTLYALLSSLDAQRKNIVTLEEPVEYNLPGVTQGPINPEIGFTFEHGIRAILRQDPDIIMVGEIRDRATTSVALQAALTGHLVLSTLHTNDAPSALMRLRDMGAEAYQLNGAVSGILAQRLARKLCVRCKKEQKISEDMERFSADHGITLKRMFVAKGCEACGQRGYKGRTGIFQLLIPSPQLRSLISADAHRDEITAQAIKDGMQTLLADAVAKVQAGIVGADVLAECA